jgi:glycerol uptake facilitator-like aquaporin
MRALCCGAHIRHFDKRMMQMQCWQYCTHLLFVIQFQSYNEIIGTFVLMLGVLFIAAPQNSLGAMMHCLLHWYWELVEFRWTNRLCN